MLELNPGLIFWTIITFIAVLAILRMAAWKPLIQALVARENGIRTALDEAESAQKEARLLLDEHKRQIAKAEEESQRIIKEGRQMGERVKAEIVDKANTGARTMIEQAKE